MAEKQPARRHKQNLVKTSERYQPSDPTPEVSERASPGFHEDKVILAPIGKILGERSAKQERALVSPRHEVDVRIDGQNQDLEPPSVSTMPRFSSIAGLASQEIRPLTQPTHVNSHATSPLKKNNLQSQSQSNASSATYSKNPEEKKAMIDTDLKEFLKDAQESLNESNKNRNYKITSQADENEESQENTEEEDHDAHISQTIPAEIQKNTKSSSRQKSTLSKPKQSTIESLKSQGSFIEQRAREKEQSLEYLRKSQARTREHSSSLEHLGVHGGRPPQLDKKAVQNQTQKQRFVYSGMEQVQEVLIRGQEGDSAADPQQQQMFKTAAQQLNKSFLFKTMNRKSKRKQQQMQQDITANTVEVVHSTPDDKLVDPQTEEKPQTSEPDIALLNHDQVFPHPEQTDQKQSRDSLHGPSLEGISKIMTNTELQENNSSSIMDILQNVLPQSTFSSLNSQQSSPRQEFDPQPSHMYNDYRSKVQVCYEIRPEQTSKQLKCTATDSHYEWEQKEAEPVRPSPSQRLRSQHRLSSQFEGQKHYPLTQFPAGHFQSVTQVSGTNEYQNHAEHLNIRRTQKMFNKRSQSEVGMLKALPEIASKDESSIYQSVIFYNQQQMRVRNPLDPDKSRLSPQARQIAANTPQIPQRQSMIQLKKFGDIMQENSQDFDQEAPVPYNGRHRHQLTSLTKRSGFRTGNQQQYPGNESSLGSVVSSQEQLPEVRHSSMGTLARLKARFTPQVPETLQTMSRPTRKRSVEFQAGMTQEIKRAEAFDYTLLSSQDRSIELVKTPGRTTTNITSRGEAKTIRELRKAEALERLSQTNTTLADTQKYYKDRRNLVERTGTSEIKLPTKHQSVYLLQDNQKSVDDTQGMMISQFNLESQDSKRSLEQEAMSRLKADQKKQTYKDIAYGVAQKTDGSRDHSTKFVKVQKDAQNRILERVLRKADMLPAQKGQLESQSLINDQTAADIDDTQASIPQPNAQKSGDVFESVIMPSVQRQHNQSKTTEASAKSAGKVMRTVSPKKHPKVFMNRKLDPLQSKIKEVAARKMTRDVELAALRNSLPRINQIRHARLNQELKETVFECVKPGTGAKPDVRGVTAAMSKYRHIVDHSSTESESATSSEQKSYHSFYTADEDLDEDELRRARNECKTDDERKAIFALSIRAIKAKMEKYARELRQKAERADRLKILDAFDIKPVQEKVFAEERDERKRKLFEHLDRSECMQKSLAIINCQESRQTQKKLEENSKSHMAQYMNLLGGQGQTGENEVKYASDLNRNFANFGNVCLDDQCVDVENQVLFRKRAELQKKAMSDVFERYLQKKRVENANIADEFYNKQHDHYINKIIGYQCNQSLANPEKKMAFIQHCKKAGDKALPLLSKIKDQKLTLMDYAINETNCGAFAHILKLDPNLLTSLHLHNCGIGDECMAKILTAALRQHNFRELTIGQQEVGPACAKALCKHFEKKKLKTLKLVDPQINPLSAEILLKVIEEKCRVEQLGLIKFPWTNKSWKIFCNYFKEDVMLDDIDISYSVGVSPDAYIPFLTTLSQNKRLKSVNLAWCNIVENQDIALARENAFATQVQRLKHKRIADAGKARPTNKPITMQVVQKEFAKHKDSLSPKKKGPLRPGESNEHPLRPLFEELPKDFDLAQRNEMPTIENIRTPKQQYMLFKKRALTPNAKSPKGGQKGTTSPPQTNKKGKKDGNSPEQKRTIEQEPEEAPQVVIMEEMSEQAIVATEAVYKFVRRNPFLQHLDLTRNNLSQVMLVRISLGVKCSKAMLGVHFSDNPGVTLAVKVYLNIRMKCNMFEEDIKSLNNSDLVTSLTKASIEAKSMISFGELLQQELYGQDGDALREDIQSQKTSANNFFPSLVNEQQRMKNVIEKKNWQRKLHDFPVDIDGQLYRTLVFTRVLGYKQEMPGSARWKMALNMNQECWICAGHIYSLIFWCPGSIAQEQVNPRLIHPEKIKELLKEHENEYRVKKAQNPTVVQPAIEVHNLSRQTSNDYMPTIIQKRRSSMATIREENPTICGQFTNWLPKKMYKVDQYTRIHKNNNMKFILDRMQVMGLPIDRSVPKPEMLDYAMKQNYEEIAEEYDKEFVLKWREKINSHLLFKEPQMVNYEFYREEDNLDPKLVEASDIERKQLHVFPCFLPPGKSFYAIQPTEGFTENILASLPEQEHAEMSIKEANCKQPACADYAIRRDFTLHPPKQRGTTANHVVIRKNSGERNEYGNNIQTKDAQKNQDLSMIKLFKTDTEKGSTLKGSSTVRRNQESLQAKSKAETEVHSRSPESSLIRIQISDQKVQTLFLHKTLVPYREEGIPYQTKQLHEHNLVRQFIYSESVWAPWVKDTQKTLDFVLQNDMSFTKFEKMHKDQNDIPHTIKVIKNNLTLLKEMHLELLGCTDLLPFVTWLDFGDFGTKSKFMDNVFKPANLDLLFVTVNSYNKTIQGLYRGEFIELLVRVSKVKFLDTGKVKTQAEAFQRLLDDNLIPTFKSGRWQNLRETWFHNIEVQDILFANQFGLKKVYNSYLNKVKRWIEPSEIYELFTDGLSRCKITIKRAKICYIMSKMTVTDQINKNENYLKLQFVEFLEVICRAAYHWSPQEEENSDTLSVESVKSSRSNVSGRSNNKNSMKNLNAQSAREFEEPQTKEEFIQKLVQTVQDVLETRGIKYQSLDTNDAVDSDVDISDEDY